MAEQNLAETNPSSDYVFGFGSIINTSTHGPWLASSSSQLPPQSLPGQVAIIKKSFGLQRSWNFRSKTGFTALGLSRVDNGKKTAEDINGVLFQISHDMLEGFDRRETGYDRVELPKEHLELLITGPNNSNEENQEEHQTHVILKVKPEEKIWVYIPQTSYVALADVDHPILQSYVDTVLQGCLEWGGEGMCEAFVKTTSGWSPYFLNDTPSSRRPWLFREKYTIIDRVLSKYPGTHYQDRRHPEEFASAFLIKLLRGSWGLPKRNPNFTGRDTEIQEIHRLLIEQRTDQGATATVRIVGMGGIGKTQICTEYCYRYFPSYYGLVIWLNAQSAESVVACYRQLMADTTGNDVSDKATEEVVIEMKSRLFRSKISWLLIFDNLEDPGLLDKFLPNGGSAGHVLVTSRLTQSSVSSDFVSKSVITLNCLQPSESVDLLIRSAGRQNIHSQAQVDAAYLLSERLGNLPLALGMAAAYMYRCDVDCSEYLARYAKSEEEKSALLLGNEGVASSLSLSLDAIKNENAGAWEMLSLLCWLGPDQITKKLLRSLLTAKAEYDVSMHEAAVSKESLIPAFLTKTLPPVMLLLSLGGAAVFSLIASRQRGHTTRAKFSTLAVVSATASLAIQASIKRSLSSTNDRPLREIATETPTGPYTRRSVITGDAFERADEIWNILKSFSLLNVKEGNGSIHRLLGQALRLSQDELEGSRSLQICLRALQKAWKFHPDRTETWQDTILIAEHVREVVLHSVNRKMGSSTRKLEISALSCESAVFSAMVLNRFEEAQKSLELSLEILGSMNLTGVGEARSETFYELGRVSRYKGDFKKSEEALTLALKIRNNLTKSEPSVPNKLAQAAILHELGVLEVKKHKLDTAADFLQQALDLRRHLEVTAPQEDTEAACASTLHQLSAVHLARKPPALDIAQSLLNEALGLNMQIGARAATLKQLARVAIRRGEFDSADRRLRQALDLYRELYGQNTLHINVAAVKFQLGVLAFQREHLDEAWAHFSECLQARKAVYSYLRGCHIEVSTVLHELGCVAIAQKQYDRASEMLEAEKATLDQLCELSNQKERLHQARLTNLTWLRKCAKEQGDDQKARVIAGQRSHLKHSAKTEACDREGTESKNFGQVNLLQQEALRCRLVARQFAIAESNSRDSAALQLTSALRVLMKEVERSNKNIDGSNETLRDAVLQFHASVLEAMHDQNKRTIFAACDRLRDVLRAQGMTVNDTVKRKGKKGKGTQRR